MEFYDVNFSYIDNDTFEEHFVSVPEQGGGKLIPEGMCNPGQVYTVSQGKSGMIGVFRLESQMLPGNGKFERTGLNSDGKCKEAANTAFNYLKANGNRISGTISTTTKDYIINYQDLQGIGMTEKLALPTLIALCSIALGKPTLSSLAVLGEISIAGTMLKVDELANALQVCLDSGAKKVLLPITSAADLGTAPADLIGCFNLISIRVRKTLFIKHWALSDAKALIGRRRTRVQEKRSKKRERIPVIDTLIDLAGAMTLDYLAAKRRQKYGTKHSKKIDPYAATGAAMGMGLIKDTDDLIKFGGVLGAMGAFDSDDDSPVNKVAYMAPRDNRYAWRLNCEDGSAYGIDPNNYETRDEYNEALSREKHGWRDYCEDGSDYGISPEDYETAEEYNAAIDTAEFNSFNENEDDELIIPDDSSENIVGETSPECTSKVAVTRLENMIRMQQMISMYMFTAL